MNNNKVIYLHSKQDIANIVRSTIEELNQAQSSNDWWKDNGTYVLSEALVIWLDRLHNYAAYEAGILEEARKVGALVRVGV